MMDDYLFDGLGPSPEALQAWDESRAAREAAEQERAPPTLEEQLEHEKARAAALEDHKSFFAGLLGRADANARAVNPATDPSLAKAAVAARRS